MEAARVPFPPRPRVCAPFCFFVRGSSANSKFLTAAKFNARRRRAAESAGGARAVDADGNNHIYGFGYDASGNTLNDGTIAYTYDAESHMATAAGVTYAYDAQDRRVTKSSGKNYLYGLGGEILAETDQNGNVSGEYVFFGGKRVAMIPGNIASTAGFEQGVQGWTYWGPETIQLIKDSTRAHSGNYYLDLSGSGTQAGAFNGVQTAPLTNGQGVTGGGWVYQESGSAGAADWQVGVYDKNNNALAYLTSGNSVVGSWVSQSESYTVPSTANCPCHANLYVQVNNVTEARFDDGFLSTNPASLQIVQNLDYLPFGELNSSDSGVSTHEFTGLEHDAETNLDHTWFRKYASSQGRWMTPDPAGRKSVNPTNPQSWNRYSYVLNDPMDYVDPLGLNNCPDSEHTCGDDPSCPDCGAAGVDLFGGFNASDPLGCGWSDFWGGDCAAEWWLLDPSGRHQSQLLTDEARYLSILNTGWDPELQRWEWNWHSLETDLAMALNNPNCAALVGGSDTAANLISNMSFTDPGTAAAIVYLTSQPSPFTSDYLNWYAQLANLQAVASGEDYALTLIAPGGQSLGYVLGPSFNSLGASQQMTVMIHEMSHAAHASSGGGSELSPMQIGPACGTAIP